MLYDDPQNSPEATFTQLPSRNPIKPVSHFWNVNLPVFTWVQSIFVPVLVLFTRVHIRISRKHFPLKQTKDISFAYKIQQTPLNEG